MLFYHILFVFDRINRDLGLIKKHLLISENDPEENVGLVLIISLLTACSRKLHVSINPTFS